MNANWMELGLVAVLLCADVARAQDAATNGVAAASTAAALASPSPPAPGVEGSPAAAPVATPDVGRWTLGGRFGEDRNVGQLGVMLPLGRIGRTWCFADLGGSVVAEGEQEMSVGFVARHWLPSRDVILGVNAFYDLRQSEEDHTFHQLSGGAEVLSRWVDGRVNVYHPFTDPQSVSVREDRTVATAGRVRTTTTALFRVSEEALRGVDGEVGVWLPYVGRWAPTAVYLGAYAFDSEFAGEDVSGIRTRLECRVHPNMTLDAEWFEENAVRDSEFVVGVSVHLPFDFWHGWHMAKDRSRTLPFSQRLDEPVRRDLQVHAARTASLPVSQIATQQSIAGPRRPKVCHDYSTLDDNGDVVIITVCE